MNRVQPGVIISPKKSPLRIHVNQHHIRSNKASGTDLPVITIKRGSENYYANGIQTKGTVRLVYSGCGDAKPILACGARLVMETDDEIEVIK